MEHLATKRRFEFPNPQTRELFRAVLSLDTLEECEQFFRDLCTLQELKAMAERWQIAKMVTEGLPYRVITRKTGASSTTIARVAHWVRYGEGGYEKLCERFKVGPGSLPMLYSTKEQPLVSISDPIVISV